MSSKVSDNEMEEKTKQKRGGSGMGDTMKMTWNVRSVNEKNSEKRPCGEIKNVVEIN